ncbi:MAG: hypothetical protein AAGF85_15195 [Bacteroidota bacterium]
MKTLKILLLVLLVNSQSIAQNLDPLSYEGNLIEFLTEVNLYAEGHMNKHFCQCKENDSFLDAYRDLRIAQNRFINAFATELLVDKSNSAINKFIARNTSTWVQGNRNYLPEIDSKFNNFLRISGCAGGNEQEAFLPTAVTVAELTGIANSIITLINKGKDRRDTMKAAIISALENLKIPSVSNYKCGEK